MTSAAERACTLVGNMLAAGPRDAAEILAAAGGDKISARTAQRAAIALGAVKTKAGFNGGWTWRLPVDDVGSRNMLEAPKKDRLSFERTYKDSKAPTAQPVSGMLKDTKVSLRVKTEQPAPGALKDAQVAARLEPSRAEVIAARLRKLEVGRGKVAPIYALDPRVVRWAQSGVSDPDLREAYELAVYALVREGSREPVKAGFLSGFIDQVISEGAKA